MTTILSRWCTQGCCLQPSRRRRARSLWSKVFDNLKSYPSAPIATNIDMAFAMRQNNPQFKQLVDEFVSTHAAGTSFGNTLMRRYLQNTKWVTNATSQKDMEKFLQTVDLFKKYAAEYNFDYLMLAAQGYQESKLNQSERSPVGAVGIMQVQPKFAAASPINIPNVAQADPNIHAGAKMLRNIADTYFNDPKIDPDESHADGLCQLQRRAQPHRAPAERSCRHGG